MPALPVTALVNLHLTSPVAFAGLAVAGVAVALLAGWLLVEVFPHPRLARVAARSTSEPARRPPATRPGRSKPSASRHPRPVVPASDRLTARASRSEADRPAPPVVDRHSPASTFPKEQPGRRRRPVHRDRPPRASATPSFPFVTPPWVAPRRRHWRSGELTCVWSTPKWVGTVTATRCPIGSSTWGRAPARDGHPARDEVPTLVADRSPNGWRLRCSPRATHVPDLSGLATCTTLAS